MPSSSTLLLICLDAVKQTTKERILQSSTLGVSKSTICLLLSFWHTYFVLSAYWCQNQHLFGLYIELRMNCRSFCLFNLLWDDEETDLTWPLSVNCWVAFLASHHKCIKMAVIPKELIKHFCQTSELKLEIYTLFTSWLLNLKIHCVDVLRQNYKTCHVQKCIDPIVCVTCNIYKFHYITGLHDWGF